MERPIPISWPSGGLVEGWSFSDQPENTAREYQNVRAQDRVTGRLRGSQRSGLSKYLESALKTPGTKAHGLVSFFVDNRQVSYSALASDAEIGVWDATTPGGTATLNVKTDRQGNVYALYGNAGVAKYSADGALLWQLALPAEDPAHLARALAVDDSEIVYAGISQNGEQAKAKLWAFEQLPDNKTQKLWEIAPKAYIEDIKLFDGKLYTCQNESDRNRAYVRIYEFITTPNPELSKEWRVPYPVNSIAVKKDGSVFVACEAGGETTNYFRAGDQKYPEMAVDSVVWTPLQLTDYSKRIWAWYVADDIDQFDVASEIEDGVEILQWRDRSRQARHLFADLPGLNEGPVLARDAAPGGHAGVRFNKPDASSPYQRLVSDYNSSYSKSTAEEQRTMVPSYTDSMFAMWIVARLSKDGTTEARALFHVDRDNNTGSAPSHVIFVNANSTNGASSPPTFSPGDVYWFTGEAVLSGGDGTAAGSILHASFDDKPGTATANPGQMVIICCVSDGQVSGSTQESLFQINGFPVDLFQGKPQFNTDQSRLNFTYAGVTKPFLGDIFEILVLDRKSRSDASQNVLTYDQLEQSSLPASQTVNEMTTITAYLAHKYGMQLNLPNSSDSFPHPFGRTGSTPDFLAAPPAASGLSTAQGLANKYFACVVKYSPEGAIMWTANEMETVSGNRTGGFGYAVAVNSDGNVYSVGPTGTGGGSQDNAQIRLIIDQGSDFSLATADGAWSTAYPSNYNQTYHYPRIDVDEFDNLYLPFPRSSGSIAGYRVYKKDGTLLQEGTTGPETASYCIAVDRRMPDYRSDLTDKRAEFVVVGTNQAELDGEDLFKIRIVQATQAAGPVRNLYTMGVSGGDIVRFVGGGSVTTPTGGSAALDSTARYVQATTLYKKAYWTDGRQYRVYDPITNAIAEYKCLSAGQMPSRCALIESWRGRIVLARSADEPHNWFLSKKDEPTNFDYFPPVPDETQAVAGNNSAAGLCPDIINSIVPYSEDVLVFGGDHSIWALVGDPAAGGRLELVSDITGMAFGRPWCKDPNGVLYFVGSRGGLFRWLPGGKPERLSLYRIERQLQEIDFGTYHVKLAWNYQDEGLHILQCPFGEGGDQVSHWFWEQKPDAFAKDIFGTTLHTNVQPTDVLTIDGDAFDDRVLVFGCEDGFIRQLDPDAKSDDTQTDLTTKIAIDQLVTIFPLPGDEAMTGMEMQFQGLTVVLGDRDDGCRYELFSSDEPDSFGVARRAGVLGPGRNPPKWDRIVGPYCGLRLRNAATDEGFSFERAYIYAARAGMVRARQLD